MSNGFYGREAFDAQTILAQMLVMQTLFYLLLGLACSIVDVVFGVPLSLDQMLSSKAMGNMSTRLAWATIFSIALSALFNVFALRIVVERARKCLDFGATIYILHLFVCCLHAGFPSHWEWWAVNLGAMVFSIVLGEYVCARREMREITIVRRAPMGMDDMIP
mmetsp:Transcript_68867/g.164300  ORF Transcript_68867/g.164300 Transcript_68867/m.164300 type:complete len:163 (+) Transcript_68867:348-836(+)